MKIYVKETVFYINTYSIVKLYSTNYFYAI